MRLFKAGCAATLFFAAAFFWCAEAKAVVAIGELLPNPGGLDANGDGAADNIDDEYVKLLNLADAEASLSGWSLSDAVTTRHLFSAGDAIPALGSYTLFGLDASSGSLGLNNGGDTVTLWNGGGQEVDSFAYDSSEPGIPLVRELEPPSAPDQPAGGPVVPEPASSFMLGTGMVWLLAKRRRLPEPKAAQGSSVQEMTWVPS